MNRHYCHNNDLVRTMRMCMCATFFFQRCRQLSLCINSRTILFTLNVLTPTRSSVWQMLSPSDTYFMAWRRSSRVIGLISRYCTRKSLGLFNMNLTVFVRDWILLQIQRPYSEVFLWALSIVFILELELVSCQNLWCILELRPYQGRVQGFFRRKWEIFCESLLLF